jgi:hypothetical protein
MPSFGFYSAEIVTIAADLECPDNCSAEMCNRMDVDVGRFGVPAVACVEIDVELPPFNTNELSGMASAIGK